MAIIIRAVCPNCGWTPEEELTLETVRGHYEEAGHPFESDADLQLEFLAYCVKDDTALGQPTRTTNHAGYQKLYFDCPTCHRSYTLKQPYPSVPDHTANHEDSMPDA